jgi:hypothetical protein
MLDPFSFACLGALGSCRAMARPHHSTRPGLPWTSAQPKGWRRVSMRLANMSTPIPCLRSKQLHRRPIGLAWVPTNPCVHLPRRSLGQGVAELERGSHWKPAVSGSSAAFVRLRRPAARPRTRRRTGGCAAYWLGSSLQEPVGAHRSTLNPATASVNHWAVGDALSRAYFGSAGDNMVCPLGNAHLIERDATSLWQIHARCLDWRNLP